MLGVKDDQAQIVENSPNGWPQQPGAAWCGLDDGEATICNAICGIEHQAKTATSDAKPLLGRKLAIECPHVSHRPACQVGVADIEPIEPREKVVGKPDPKRTVGMRGAVGRDATQGCQHFMIAGARVEARARISQSQRPARFEAKSVNGVRLSHANESVNRGAPIARGSGAARHQSPCRAQLQELLPQVVCCRIVVILRWLGQMQNLNEGARQVGQYLIQRNPRQGKVVAPESFCISLLDKRNPKLIASTPAKCQVLLGALLRSRRVPTPAGQIRIMNRQALVNKNRPPMTTDAEPDLVTTA
mmetsp:Transcript_66894/g.192325  ORF Transcript_66894/g.192325 Transcript_66894/m.192325 type:complete len:302 (-) Transcript_66894:848-1753(-)